MATSKKSAKGNKTAHVLNLLTAPDDSKEGVSASEEATAETPAEQAPPTGRSRPLLPPILEVAQSNDDNLAQQIQHALEEELEDESKAEPAAPASSGGNMGQAEAGSMPDGMNSGGEPASEHVLQPAPAPQPAPEATAPSGINMSQAEVEAMPDTVNVGSEPVPEPQPAPQPAPAPEPAPAPDPAPAPQPEPAAPVPSGVKMSQAEAMPDAVNGGGAPPSEPEPAPQPVPAPDPAPAPQPEEEDVTYTNVMQVLVEEKAPRYIEKFGLCTCKHCAADVKALTLSNLVPKYVVLSKLDRIPMLTVYEGRYSTTIFAQLTRACKIVMDHPHHSRE